MKKLFLFLSLICLFGFTDQPETKVMSYNIRVSPNDEFDGENSWLYRKKATIKMIESEQPDLLGIQEGLFRQVNYIEDNCPDYGRYGVGRDDGQQTGEANAIFYKKERFELIDCGTFWLSETPDIVSRGWDAACNRVVTWVKLRDKKGGRGEVYFFNTHLDHLGAVARVESAKLLVAKIKEIAPEDASIFLTGDFNSNYNSQILNPIREYMDMTRESAPKTDNLNTFNGWGKQVQGEKSDIIDHIFHKNKTPISYKTLTGDYGVPYISDHYPIMAIYY
jgi:endonuclease/exonuclease/phosphatase family metal-dependent hydrolase